MSWEMPPPKWDTLAGRVLDTFFDHPQLGGKSESSTLGFFLSK